MSSSGEEGFVSFVESRGAELRRYAVLLAGSEADGDDLLQAVLLRAYLRWDRLEEARSVTAYVRMMITNEHVSSWRRWGRKVRPTAVMPELPVYSCDGGEAAERVGRLLAGVTKQQRAALVMRFYEELDDSEIAEGLGCSVSTARTHISRGLARIRESAGMEGIVQ